MQQPETVPRNPVAMDSLQPQDLIVAYADDEALAADEPELFGAIQLLHSNGSGGWDVKYRTGGALLDGQLNLNNCEHVFYISAGPRVIGHNGPWHP